MLHVIGVNFGAVFTFCVQIIISSVGIAELSTGKELFSGMVLLVYRSYSNM